MPIVCRTNSWEIELNKIDPILGFHRTNRRNREGGGEKGDRRRGREGEREGDKRKYERAQYRGENVKRKKEGRKAGTKVKGPEEGRGGKKRWGGKDWETLSAAVRVQITWCSENIILCSKSALKL